MLTCPLCKSELAEGTPRCPRCQADVSLLTDFAKDSKTLLVRADAKRRNGDIAGAVQDYVGVLEIDPTNAEARAALGPILRYVRGSRVFESVSFRDRMMLLIVGVLMFAASFALGVWMGYHAGIVER